MEKEVLTDYISFLNMIGKIEAVKYIKDTVDGLKQRLMVETFIFCDGEYKEQILDLHIKYYNPQYLHLIKNFIKDY